MQENVSLIKEINDLRKELKIARTQIHDLEATVKQYTKKTGGDDTDIYAVMLKAPSALVENELEEKNKIIDMQKFEIRKLRQAIETGSRPSSSSRLPPMQSLETSAWSMYRLCCLKNVLDCNLSKRNALKVLNTYLSSDWNILCIPMMYSKLFWKKKCLTLPSINLSLCLNNFMSTGVLLEEKMFLTVMRVVCI